MTLTAYLLLVSFANYLNGFDSSKLATFNASPYNGIAIILADQYDDQRHVVANFDRNLKKIKSHTGKDLWPWVFWNRVIGFNSPGHSGSPKLANKSYFARVRGWDLYNKAGNLRDFYNMYEIALWEAKALGAPGIVVDLETYNDYSTMSVKHLAEEMGTSPANVESQLTTIGGNLANIAGKVYPTAVVWFFLTRVATRDTNSDYSQGYLVRGMLREAQAEKSSIRIVSGGEAWGYCWPSLMELERATAERKKVYQHLLDQYPNLVLGGTIAPWTDASHKRGWMLSGACAENGQRTAADFQPFLRFLGQAYTYVWVYASGDAAGYDPFSKERAAPVNLMLRRSFGRP